MVGILAGQDAAPVTLFLAGLGGTVIFDNATVMKAVLTGFDMTTAGNVQIGHTLRQKIYATIVGGERAGTFQASGIWFGNVCNGDSTTGVDKVFGFYEATRFSTSGTVVTISVAQSTSLVGILREFHLGAQDAITNTGQFTLVFDLMPRNVLYGGPGSTDTAADILTAIEIDGLLGTVMTGVSN